MQCNSLTGPCGHVCVTRGLVPTRRFDPGFGRLHTEDNQKSALRSAKRRERCMQTRAANSSSSSVNSANTRSQENSAPAMAAAAHQSRDKADAQPQEGMSCVLSLCIPSVTTFQQAAVHSLISGTCMQTMRYSSCRLDIARAMFVMHKYDGCHQCSQFGNDCTNGLVVSDSTKPSCLCCSCYTSARNHSSPG